MKKILLILLLLVAVKGFAQQKGLPFWNSAFSTNASQYFARYDVKPAGDTLKWYAEFIDSCTLNGTWALIDEMWIFANNTSANSLIGVKGYKNCTAVNSPSFSAYRGFTGNGSTSYLNTQFNPSVNGINHLLNSASFGVYSRTNSAIAAEDIGARSSTTAYSTIEIKWNDNNYYSRINGTDASVQTVSGITRSDGLICAVRNGTTRTDYQNGVSIVSTTMSSSSLPNGNLYIGACNNGGTPRNYSTRQYAFGFIAGGLTAQQQLNLYNCLQRLLTKIGANV